MRSLASSRPDAGVRELAPPPLTLRINNRLSPQHQRRDSTTPRGLHCSLQGSGRSDPAQALRHSRSALPDQGHGLASLHGQGEVEPREPGAQVPGRDPQDGQLRMDSPPPRHQVAGIQRPHIPHNSQGETTLQRMYTPPTRRLASLKCFANTH